LMSNWMVFVAWYIVVYRKPFHVRPKLPLIILSSVLPSIAWASYFLSCSLPTKQSCVDFAVAHLYDNLRTTSVGINFAFVTIIMYRLGVCKLNYHSHLTP
jgi:hypothetical protein